MGGRSAAGAVGGSKGHVVSRLIVAARDKDRYGLAPLSVGLPEGTVEDALNPGAENPPPGGHVPLHNGAVAAMNGELPPAA